MENVALTQMQDLIRTGRIVEAGSLLTMREAEIPEEERETLRQEMAQRMTEAAALVARAEAKETEGKPAEAKVLYEAVLLLTRDYPGIQDRIKQTNESQALAKAMRRRTQRARGTSIQLHSSTQRKRRRPIAPLLFGLLTLAAAAFFLSSYFKVPSLRLPTMTTQPAPAQKEMQPQPATPPAIPAAVVTPPPAPEPAAPEVTTVPKTAEPVPTPATEIAPIAANPSAPQESPNTEPLSTPASSPVAVPAQPSEISPGKRHRVQPGDSLSQIAAHVLCHEGAWRKIYQQNRGKITDPNHLPQGIELDLQGIPSRCRP